jgi:hypothetical protein
MCDKLEDQHYIHVSFGLRQTDGGLSELIERLNPNRQETTKANNEGAMTFKLREGYSYAGRNMHPAGTSLHLAREYLEAAKALERHPTPVTGMIWLEESPEVDALKFRTLRFPLFFCLTHAVELMLKGFLSAHGKGKETPGWKDHNIGKLVEACYSLGLTITDRTRSFIDDAIAENSDYTFRFHERISPVAFPPTKTAIGAVDDLDESVYPTVRPYLVMQRGETISR